MTRQLPTRFAHRIAGRGFLLAGAVLCSWLVAAEPARGQFYDPYWSCGAGWNSDAADYSMARQREADLAGQLQQEQARYASLQSQVSEAQMTVARIQQDSDRAAADASAGRSRLADAQHRRDAAGAAAQQAREAAVKSFESSPDFLSARDRIDAAQRDLDEAVAAVMLRLSFDPQYQNAQKGIAPPKAANPLDLRRPVNPLDTQPGAGAGAGAGAGEGAGRRGQDLVARMESDALAADPDVLLAETELDAAHSGFRAICDAFDRDLPNSPGVAAASAELARAESDYNAAAQQEREISTQLATLADSRQQQEQWLASAQPALDQSAARINSLQAELASVQSSISLYAWRLQRPPVIVQRIEPVREWTIAGRIEHQRWDEREIIDHRQSDRWGGRLSHDDVERIESDRRRAEDAEVAARRLRAERDSVERKADLGRPERTSEIERRPERLPTSDKRPNSASERPAGSISGGSQRVDAGREPATAKRTDPPAARREEPAPVKRIEPAPMKRVEPSEPKRAEPKAERISDERARAAEAESAARRQKAEEVRKARVEEPAPKVKAEPAPRSSDSPSRSSEKVRSSGGSSKSGSVDRRAPARSAPSSPPSRGSSGGSRGSSSRR